ncbi:hypothetical protein C3L33_05565, partial [Rhododendron williamsianum]
MIDRYWIAFFVALSLLVGAFDASAGDFDPIYRVCTEQCEKTGCVGERCFANCKVPSDGASLDGPWYMQEPLYLQWKHWDCQSDCRYHCMVDREKEKAALGHGPVKYHGKWPFVRVYGIQDLVNCRDVDVTEKLDYSSAVALLGYSLILAIIRSFSVTKEAAQVMVSAPLIAFVTTHILYLNNYQLDYGWNMKVCVVMAVAQLLIWAVWAGVTRHPSRLKLWVVVLGGGLAMLLEIYDFPPYEGYVDAHALWHATTIPLTYIWWNFIKDDAEFRTSSLLKKAK